jgi:3-keto-disaccharide hydrolase
MTCTRLVVPLALLALVFATSGCASTSNGRDSEKGFAPLFNGKDLTGWEYGTGAGAKAGNGYQVAEDGILYCTKTDGGNLYTTRDYDNFILRFDFKLERDGNNGIGVHAPTTGDVSYAGIEIQVLDDEGPKHKGIIKSWQHHGSVYGCVAAKPGSLKPVGEWNTEEIVVDGRRIKVTCNGQVIVDADLDKDVTDPEAIAKHPGLNRTTGRIALLGHGTRVEFRNLQVKELK